MIKKILICSLLFINSSLVFAQSDSTYLPGLSTSIQTPTNGSLGTGVPDPNQLDAVTTTTETEVLPCPSGYYANGAVPTDGTDVADENVTGGVIYDQTVTTDRYGTTTYGGWVEENFLCTQIPQAPACPTGYTELSPPYWDSTTNTWVGIVCQAPPPPAPACTDDANNYVTRSIPPFWGTSDYYSAWDSSMTFAINGTVRSLSADSGIYGYTTSVNAALAPYGATLGDQVSVATDRDSGISTVINKICHN